MSNIDIKDGWNISAVLISLIVLIPVISIFVYLFYLSIPSLYNKDELQKDLTNKLKDEFKINISISSDISYSILPSPHILIKNVKIYNNNLKNHKK